MKYIVIDPAKFAFRTAGWTSADVGIFMTALVSSAIGDGAEVSILREGFRPDDSAQVETFWDDKNTIELDDCSFASSFEEFLKEKGE